MQVRITYIQHNCFCLHFADRLLLFDCPGPEYRDPDAEHRLQEEIAGSRVDVFASHSHTDHFARDIRRVVRNAAETRFFVADDVADLFEGRIPRESVVLEPDSTREIGEMNISTLASNDLGVAFLLRKQGLTLYFGGDLADWQWAGLPRAARRAASIFFRGVLEGLKRRDVHLAFSNADPRLDNLAGAPRFVNHVRPDLFIPMHSFGYTKHFQLLRERISRETNTRLFLYRDCGDSIVTDIHPVNA
mgnify:CR=1 FL=1